MAVLTVAEDVTALSRLAAERFIEIVADAVHARGRAIVSLTGGSTPRRMYEALAKDPRRVQWDDVHLFWGDERNVPPEHKDSNYGMARDALLRHVPVPPENVHRMRGELPAEQAALEYEHELIDSFDLMLLGLGEDAHIASIFPGSPVLTERRRLAAAVWAPHLQAFRITLTPAALLDSRRIVMLVSGETKAEAVAAALEGPDDVRRWPAQLVRDRQLSVEWLIDRAAAQGLSSRRE